VRTCPNCGGKTTDEYKSCEICGGNGYINEVYLYGEIRWCPQQIIWILQYADIFRAGFWVTQHIESGGIQKLKVEAYFVKAGIAISEVEARLESVPNQGELLITQVEDGRTLGELSPGAYEILMYIKGKDRKDMSFSDWRKQRKYRKWEGNKCNVKSQVG